MLRRELYIGRRIWNGTRFIKRAGTNKRVARPRPRSDWKVDDLPELQIVPIELWNRVKARLLQAVTKRGF
jgi:site-specific DNA recombinase